MSELIKSKWIIGIGIAIIAAIVGFASIKFFGNDNPIEESAEKIIENTTGINIDLSPTETKQDIK